MSYLTRSSRLVNGLEDPALSSLTPQPVTYWETPRDTEVNIRKDRVEAPPV